MQILKLTSAALAYFGLAKAGLMLTVVNANASPLWAPTGFAIALLAVYGRRYALSVFAGALIANLQTGAPVSAVVAIATGNTLEALTGGWLLNSMGNLSNTFILHGRVISVLITGLVASLISATVGVVALVLTKTIPSNTWFYAWMTWWSGDVLGAWVLVPLFLQASKPRIFFQQLGKQSLDWLFIFLALFVLLIVNSSLPLITLTYFIFLFYATRGEGSVSLYPITFIAAALGIAGVIYKVGPFMGGVSATNMINLQIYIATLVLISAVMSAVQRNRQLQLPLKLSVISIVVSLLIITLVFSWEKQMERVNFSELVEDAESNLVHRFSLNEHFLISGTALFTASDKVSREEWRAFISKRDMVNRFSGMLGNGVILKVGKGELQGFAREYQLKIKNVPGGDQVNAEHGIVVYVEPEDKNSPALGLDVLSEKQRREAAYLAAQTGKFSISGPISIVQAPDQKAVLAFVPMYKNGKPSGTVEERNANLVGWVYSPIIMQKLIETAIGDDLQLLDLTVFDADQVNESGKYFVKKTGVDRFSPAQRMIEFGQRKFLFTWSRGANYEHTVGIISMTLSSFFLLLMMLLIGSQLGHQVVNHRVNARVSEKTIKLDLMLRVSEVLAKESDVDVAIQQVKRIISQKFQWSAVQTGEIQILIRSSKKNMGEIRFHNSSGIPLDPELSDALESIGFQIGEFIDKITAESDLNKNRQRLIETAKLTALGEMSSGIAHEINNPLAIIMGKATLLRTAADENRLDREKMASGIDLILSTVDRIAKIVQGLKSFSRDSSGDSFKKVQVSQIISNTLAFCRERFDHHEVQLMIDQPADGIEVECREVQISQIILNLLNNSFDAVQDSKDKWVKLQLRDLGEKIEISVTDSGPGVPPGLKDKLMQPFFTTKEVGKGTGLGLSISLGLAQDHGGSLRLDELSRNTRFVLVLPKIQKA